MQLLEIFAYLTLSLASVSMVLRNQTIKCTSTPGFISGACWSTAWRREKELVVGLNTLLNRAHLARKRAKLGKQWLHYDPGCSCVLLLQMKRWLSTVVWHLWGKLRSETMRPTDHPWNIKYWGDARQSPEEEAGRMDFPVAGSQEGWGHGKHLHFTQAGLDKYRLPWDQLERLPSAQAAPSQLSSPSSLRAL